MGKSTAPLPRMPIEDGLTTQIFQGNKVAPIRHLLGAFKTLCWGSAWSRAGHFGPRDNHRAAYFLGKTHWPPCLGGCWDYIFLHLFQCLTSSKLLKRWWPRCQGYQQIILSWGELSPQIETLEGKFFPVAFLLTADNNSIERIPCRSLGTQPRKRQCGWGWQRWGWGWREGVYKIKMCPKFLASPVLLALVLGLLTLLSFLSDPTIASLSPILSMKAEHTWYSSFLWAQKWWEGWLDTWLLHYKSHIPGDPSVPGKVGWLVTPLTGPSQRGLTDLLAVAYSFCTFSMKRQSWVNSGVQRASDALWMRSLISKHKELLRERLRDHHEEEEA